MSGERGRGGLLRADRGRLRNNSGVSNDSGDGALDGDLRSHHGRSCQDSG